MTRIKLHLLFAGILLIFLSSNGKAQKTDSIVPHKKLIWSIKPSFDFDQRFSFILNKPVNIWGERAGLLINESFKTGIGVYFLSNSLKFNKVDQNGNPFYFAHRDVYFGTYYIEPFLIRKEYWELSVPFEIGFGESFFKVYNGNNIFLGEDDKFFFPAGVGLSGSVKFPAVRGFKPLRWIGINGLIGYRYSILQNEFKTDYDGMFWSISSTFFLDRIYDDYINWRKKRKDRKAKERSATP